jgi:transposase
MAHRYLPVDRDQPAFLPLNMYDWVPKDHVVWLVIDTVGELGTPELAARLAGGTRKSARGRRAYDPVMLLTLLVYAYCCGVLSTRAIEARCRVDATFRLACAGLVPDHSTISRFRQRACGDGGPMEDVFYAVLRVCAAAGLGRLSVVAGDGVKIGANASKEANRTEAGLRKLAAAILAGAAAAEEPDAAGTAEDLLGAEPLPGGWADPRSRLGRVQACLDDFAAQREAAAAARRAQGQAWLDARAAGQRVTKPPAAVAVEAARIGLEQQVARQQALVDDWDRKRAAGQKTGCKPVPVEASTRVARQRDRLERAQAAAAAQQQEQEQQEQGGAGEPAAEGKKKKRGSRPVRNVTDPASALMPVRGGGFKQGYNCQDVAADDRLMLGGFATGTSSDTVHAARLEAVAVKGAQVVAEAHAGPGHDVSRCHARMCTAKDPGDPGHDAAACHAQMTGAPGVLVLDAGYCPEANLTAPGDVDRLIATGNRRTMGKAAAEHPASGPPPEDATATEAMDHRLRTPEGRAAYKRRAPDVEGLHASIEDIIGLRCLSMRGLALATGEFLLAGICHNLLLRSRRT